MSQAAGVPGSSGPEASAGLRKAPPPPPAGFKVALHSEEQSTHFSQTGRRSSRRATCTARRHPLWAPIPRNLVLGPTLIPQGRPGIVGAPPGQCGTHGTLKAWCVQPTQVLSGTGIRVGGGCRGCGHSQPLLAPHLTGTLPRHFLSSDGPQVLRAGGPSPPPRRCWAKGTLSQSPAEGPPQTLHSSHVLTLRVHTLPRPVSPSAECGTGRRTRWPSAPRPPHASAQR